MSEQCDAVPLPVTATHDPLNTNFVRLLLWSVLPIYAVGRLLQLSDRVPIIIVIALHVLPPLAFAFLHGALRYGLRGISVFIGLFLLVGNSFENLSVVTGFPFGHYYFTDLMGPKVFHVPIFLALAYLGMAYLSWTLASLILRGAQSSISGLNVVLVPALAGLVMTAWDLSQDPAWSTILHLWIWPRGGIYFGVPISNFLGWYFTVYVTYQLFVFYMLRGESQSQILPAECWRLPVSFYGISASGNLLLLVPRRGFTTVIDPAGTTWRVSDVTLAGALVSIFIMGAFTVAAWLRMPCKNDAQYSAKHERNLLQKMSGTENLS